MDVGLVLVQFAHIAAGAAWLGGSIFANAVLLPFVARQPPERQRALVQTLVLGPERFMIGAAIVAVATGLLRGTAFGRIRTLESVVTPYGLVWLASIVVVVGVFAFGGLVTSPAAKRLRDDEALWRVDAAVTRAGTFARMRLGFTLELLGILTALALMAVMRFA